ncbi:MFS transporter [Rhodoplanes sp. Z2-YC6860]|uniref:MFS transporter n=1 Tax=Rhodoplanes sp. Z2-YC6860 TaxID=674703 RepID=UPI00078CCCF1|nr:MFS transporter [Rhodoplanes sp. Z2-YC6860]AMN40975.1 MFS permease [Rhodoplanes sp. Z2-YC6860]
MPDRLSAWRTPLVILFCGCLIGLLGFGPRSSFGFFLGPMSNANGWGRDVFALALAIEMLLWGATQPFAGALADRFGATWVLATGAILYALGIVWMSYAHTTLELHLSAGVLIGLGLGGCSFTLVLGAFGKLLPEGWRTIGFGIGTAAGSLGQLVFSPLAVAMIRGVGWQETLWVFAAVLLLIVPLAMMIAAPRGGSGAPTRPLAGQTVSQALAEALGHKSYVLLIIGYFTCGFQLFFITVHLPAYLVDRGVPIEVGGWAIGLIGLTNIVGSISAGYLVKWMPRRYLLSLIYFSRSAAILAFILAPISTASTLLFSAVMGLLWLSTIPPTSALVAVMFGQRWLTMLLGVAFFSHQLGGFLGVWLGGVLFERTGSYDVIWWGTIMLGVASAVINLPIVEKPVARPTAAAA